MKSEAFGTAVVSAFSDPNLFLTAFQPADSWRAWLIALRLLFGLPLLADEWDLARECTGRAQAFTVPPTEAWFLCGRRSGKSRVLALLAVCAACFRDYREYLAPGERALVMVLAKDRDQAQVIFGYAKALITETPMLAAMIERETAETLDLTNGVSIAVHTSSYKSVRGRTLVAALADECAFWESDDSRNPAEAVIRALRPSLATIPGAFLLCASSTYTAGLARPAAITVALRRVSLAGGRAVRGLFQALRQGQLAGARVAGRHAHDESVLPARGDRCSL